MKFPLSSAVTSHATAAEDATALRILPVGDSITEGGEGFVCNRPELHRLLSEAGAHFMFVGSKRAGSPHGVLRHEGHSGKDAEFLATTLAKNIHENVADIVLLHSGHNHSAEEKPVAGILASTETMIHAVRKANPKAAVLLAQVIPSGKLPKYGYIPQLNESLGALATQLHTPSQPVIPVNQAEGFDWKTDTVDDRVYPNARGAAKMAARWFSALTPFIQKNQVGPGHRFSR